MSDFVKRETRLTSPPASAKPSSAGLTGPRVQAEFYRLAAEPLAPGLYLVATPIGNLADITLRALTVLSRADVIYCEDTRHSLTLSAHYAITTHLRPYHEHNGARERPKILAALADGQRIALISDAGTPLISDPGYKLVREAVAAGHRVEGLPGPSAALTALTVAGLPTDSFYFAGFLPPRSASRRSRIKDISAIDGTLILFEAPSRITEALADLADVLGPRPAAIARELTKRFETVQRGTLTELAAQYGDGIEPRGEFVIVIGPPVETAATDAQISDAMAAAMTTLSLRDAARSVSDDLGCAKSRAYDIGLKQK